MKHIFTSIQLRKVAVILAFSMTILGMVPPVDAGFLQSDQALSRIEREQDLAVMQKALENKVVRARLAALGYDADEITARLDQLPDEDLHRFAGQIETVTAGGDALGLVIVVLVIVLLVVVILKVMDKRIIIS